MARLVFDPTHSDLEEVDVPIGGTMVRFKRGEPRSVPDALAARICEHSPELFHLAADAPASAQPEQA